MNDKVFPTAKWERFISKERQEEQSVNKFLKLTQPKSDEVWADIGCGPGYFTIPLAQKVKKVLAVDVKEQMLNICKKRADDINLHNIEYLQSNGKLINYQFNFFDKILIANVLHEFDDRQKALMEMNRLLRTNGYVFVIDWKYEDINSGPPLEHRLPMQKVINDFLANGFNLLHNWEVYEQFYFLSFQKINELK